MGWAALQWDSNWFPKFQARPLYFQAQPVNPDSQQHQHDGQELHGGLFDLHQLPRAPSQLSRGLQPIALKHFLSWHGKTLWYQLRKIFFEFYDKKIYNQVVCLTTTATPQDFNLADPNNCRVFWQCRWLLSLSLSLCTVLSLSLSLSPTTVESFGNAGDYSRSLIRILIPYELKVLEIFVE